MPPFENALFALKDGQVSDVVQSDFGYHIIELTGVKPADIKPLDAVRGDITDELRKQAAQKKFTDAAEAFANGVYEQGDSLAPTAQKFGLQVMTADGVTRTPAPGADPASPLANAKLLAALFSADSLKNHHNTEAVETSPGTLVAARIVDDSPAAKRPLAEVADGIKSRLTQAEAGRLALQAGQAALAKLRAAPTATVDGKSFGAPVAVSRVERSDVPPDAVTDIFRTDASKLPAFTGTLVPSGDYVVYEITGVTSRPDPNPGSRTALSQSIAKQLGAIEFGGYVADLRRRVKVQVSAPYADLIDKRDATPPKPVS